MEAACLWNRYVPNALAAKALASTQAFIFAQELGFWKVEVDGDFLVVLRDVNFSKSREGATKLLTSWPKRGFAENVMPGGWRRADGDLGTGGGGGTIYSSVQLRSIDMVT
ncbi:hypothetical protein PVK06_017709 [Gossypium arboreum]|uniref:RNase H type-1 domain-containing protein n=1 Tax=Gossypium arboreum TaxID=29729 RepID=A0ABR0Q3R5_GOSAR|nr:hypothetical protein PVK06_017709 [Gossypium arboreum]